MFPSSNIIGTHIREKRLAAQLDMAVLAKQSSVSIATISRIENATG